MKVLQRAALENVAALSAQSKAAWRGLPKEELYIARGLFLTPTLGRPTTHMASHSLTQAGMAISATLQNQSSILAALHLLFPVKIAEEWPWSTVGLSGITTGCGALRGLGEGDLRLRCRPTSIAIHNRRRHWWLLRRRNHRRARTECNYPQGLRPLALAVDSSSEHELCIAYEMHICKAADRHALDFR